LFQHSLFQFFTVRVSTTHRSGALARPGAESAAAWIDFSTNSTKAPLQWSVWWQAFTILCWGQDGRGQQN